MKHRDASNLENSDPWSYVKLTFASMTLFALLYAGVFALAWFTHVVWGVGLTPSTFIVLFAMLLVCILVLLGIADPRRIAKPSTVDAE